MSAEKHTSAAMAEISPVRLCLSLIYLSSLSSMIAGFLMDLRNAESGQTSQNLQEGQRLAIWCHLTNRTWQRSCNASNMSIRQYTSQHGYLIVGTQTPTAEYNITMVIEKATTNVSGLYYCLCHETALMSYRVTVNVRAPPVEPENITVIFENFEILTVCFNPVRNSASLNAETTWSLHVYAPFSQSSRTTCSPTNDEYCCKMEDTSSFRFDPVNITIQVNNEIGNISTTREERLCRKVRPGPMVVVPVGNRTWVDLTWVLPSHLLAFNFGGLHYMLIFTSQLFPPRVENRTCLSKNADELWNCREMKERVTGLHPDTAYNVTLRSHPVDGGYWSAPKTVTFSTLEDAPGVGPRIHPWLYATLWRFNRTFIYPQELKPQDKTGRIIAYEYWVEGWESNRRELGTPHSLSVDSYEPDGPALTVRLWACTSIGCSQNFSSITLPGGLNSVPRPGWLDVEVVNASFYRLFWEALDLQPSTSVRLHWCWGEVQSHSQSSLVLCKTEMNSREVEGTANNALLSVPQTEDPCSGARDCSVRFGISVERDGSSSGIIWNTCIFSLGKEPELVSGVFIDRRKAPQELTLTWDYPCRASPNDLRGRPFKFESRLSPSTELEINATICDDMQGPKQRSEAIHWENRHQFRDLQSGKPYLICVRSLSLSSQTWQEGPWTMKSVLPFVPGSTLVSDLVISLSVIVTAIVIVVAALFLVRKRYKEKKFPINTEFFREERSTAHLTSVPECEDLPQWTPPIQPQESVVGATEVSQEAVTTSCSQEDPETDRSKHASESDYHFQLHFPEGSCSTGQQMETPDSNHSSTCYNYINDAYDGDMEDAVNGVAGTKEEETTAVEVKKGEVLPEPSRLQEGRLSWDMPSGVVSFDSSGKSSSDHDSHYIRSGHRLSGGSVDLECSHPSVV